MENRTSVAYRWYVVTLLLLVFILSYFDRYILSLLIDPIKHDLNISDFQVGLLLGPAFSAFNVMVAIPLGLAADRGSRKWILIGGIFVWCTMTTMSGFAMSFLPLLFLRFGLGFGEAVVSPCSVSIISDYFPRRQRARAISVYMAGPYLGAGLAFLLGGYVISFFHGVGSVNLLGLRSFEPWQLAFIAVGIPGMLFGFLLLTVREPPRTEKLHVDSSAKVSSVRYMAKRWRGFGVVTLGATCNFAMSTLTLWTVPLFQRVYGWDLVKIGVVTGGFYLIAGPIGTFIAVWGSRAFGKKNGDGALRVLLLGLIITVPMCTLYPIMPTGTMAAAVMFAAFIGKTIATAGGPAALQMITPGEIRSRAMAIFNTFVFLTGPVIGPPLIGLITDWADTPKAIGPALSGFAAAVGIPTLIIMYLGARHYRGLVREMTASQLAEEGKSAALQRA